MNLISCTLLTMQEQKFREIRINILLFYYSCDSQFEITFVFKTLEWIYDWKHIYFSFGFLWLHVRFLKIPKIKKIFGLKKILRLFMHGTRVNPNFAGLFLGFSTEDIDFKIPFNFDTFWVIFQIYASPGIWLITIAVIITSLMPYLFVETIKSYWKYLQNLTKVLIGKKVYKVNGGFDNDAFENSYL